MLADCVPKVSSNKRVMEGLLPFLIASTQGLLCNLIENVSVEQSGPLPLLSEGLCNVLESRFIKCNRSQVLPKSINDKSSRGEKGSFKCIIIHWNCKLQNTNCK